MLRKEFAMGCVVVALSVMLVGCAAPEPTATSAAPTKTPIPPTATQTPIPQPSPIPTREISEAPLLITVKSGQANVFPCPSMQVCGGEMRHAFTQGDQVEATGYSTEFRYIQVRYPGGLGWVPRGSVTIPEEVEELLPVVAWDPSEPGGENNLFYSPGNYLEVRLPETTDGPFPALLLLHGASVDKNTLYSLADYFTARGYATVLADWGHAQTDAFCALAWLHANVEEYGFDPERVAVLGHSYGGYAAALLGAVDDSTEFMQDCPHLLPESGWIQAVITYGGVPFGAKGGLSETGTESSYLLPSYWVDGSEPPFLLIHGEGDVNTPSPEPFAAQLQEAGVDARVVMIPDAIHTAICDASKSGFQSACKAAEAFLAEVLE